MGCAEGRSPIAGSLRVSLRYNFFSLPCQDGRQGTVEIVVQQPSHSTLVAQRCTVPCRLMKNGVCRGAKPHCRESEGVPQVQRSFFSLPCQEGRQGTVEIVVQQPSHSTLVVQRCTVPRRLMKNGCAEGRSPIAGSLRVSLRSNFSSLPGKEGGAGG